MNNLIHKLNWFLASQMGLHVPTLFRSIKGSPRFLRDFVRYRLSSDEKIHLKPCLNDWYQESGDSRTEYFWQDLLVAQRICRSHPATHIDVGSRLDGFLAHVASFRTVESWDIRPLNVTIPQVLFQQIDIMDADLYNTQPSLRECCDSFSCLHTLEHLGLGRYGDTLSKEGWRIGLRNMAQALRPEGTMYLSTPVGQPRVDFNANRIFSASTLIEACSTDGLSLRQAITITPDGSSKEYEKVDDEMLRHFDHAEYLLAVLILKKHAS
jgi:hypothetical protein